MSRDTTIKHEILHKAGINTAASRRQFRKNNPDAVKLYEDTYFALDDEKLQKKFVSNNEKEVAAALIASQRMAEEHPAFVKTPGSQIQRTIANAKFEQHYQEALEDIEKNRVDTSKPSELAKFDVSQLNKSNKSPKATPRINSHEITVGCQKKQCELSAFDIEITASKHSDPLVDFFKFSFEKIKRSKKLNEQLDKPIDISEDNPTIDVFNAKPGIQEATIIGGALGYFARSLKITASGSCAVGKDDECPTVKVICDETKFDRIAGSGGTHSLELNNVDKKLKDLRLYPKSPAKPGNDWNGFVNLLNSYKDLEAPAKYHLSIRSHNPSAPYSGYEALINVYRPIILSFSTTIELVKWKKPKAKVNFKGRLDNEEIAASADLTAQDVLSSLTSYNWLLKFLTRVAKIKYGFDLLGRDEGEIDATIDSAEEASPPESDDSDWELQNPMIHFAYRRILTTLENGSGVGYKEEFFMAASPFFTYSKKVDVIKLIWGASLDFATGGGYTVAKTTSRGIKQLIAESFPNVYEFFRQVTKDVKNKLNIEDKEVDEVVGTKVKCVAEFSGAIETDNPGAGIVFMREPNKGWEPDLESTSIYGGINAQITGEVSSDLKLLKIIGFGSAIDSAGIKLQVISADNTAPVRFAVNISGLSKEKDRLLTEAETAKFSADEAESSEPKATKDEMEGATGEEPSQLGIYASFLFTGVGIYIDAYIVIAKDTTSTDYENKAQKQSENRGRRTTREEGSNTADPGESNKSVRKRMSFQIMKERESPIKAWKIPLDKVSK